MTDALKLVSVILVAFLLLVLPALVMLRLTRGMKERHPRLRLLVALLPSLAILSIIVAVTFFPLFEDHINYTRGFPTAGAPAPPPTFPWPPPTASARLLIPRGAFLQTKTIGQASSYLESALSSRGYAEISYCTVPGGVAVVTRLEHIYPDGKPFQEPNRWVADDTYRQALSLAAYVRTLFAVDEGYYRVVVFILTDQAFGSTNRTITSDETFRWLADGYNTLPQNLKAQPMSTAHQCTALIYEFQKNHGASPLLLIPSPMGAKQHLLASGLLTALTGDSAGGNP
jgi:hypothetical protein